MVQHWEIQGINPTNDIVRGYGNQCKPRQISTQHLLTICLLVLFASYNEKELPLFMSITFQNIIGMCWQIKTKSTNPTISNMLLIMLIIKKNIMGENIELD